MMTSHEKTTIALHIIMLCALGLALWLKAPTEAIIILAIGISGTSAYHAYKKREE